MKIKKIIKFISVPVFIFLIIILLPLLFPKKYAILTYHDFTKGTPENNMQKNIDEFRKEMKFLKKHGYKTLTLSDIECYMNKKCKLPRKSVLITFDDGFKNAYELAFPILEEYGFNAVLFYIGENVDNTTNMINKDELFEIQNKYPNIEIASHTFSNHGENDYRKSAEELDEDFKQMRNIVDTKYFAYPFGFYSEEYISSLRNNGFELAFGFGYNTKFRKFSNKDNRYVIPRMSFSSTYPYWKFVLRMYLPF